MKRVLIVFAKEPERGKVKTRLRIYFPVSRLLRLYKAFLKDTLNIATKVYCEEKVLAFSSTKNPQYLKKIARNFKFYKQRGRNLGERLHNTFVYAQEKKGEKVIIIGSDSPTLPFEILQEAFQKLDRYDVVLGPGADGGYYLVGLKEPCFGLFRGIKWGSNKVLDDTIKNAKRHKKRIVLLKKWFDIDEPNALIYLRQELEKQKDRSIAQWTRKFLNI